MPTYILCSSLTAEGGQTLHTNPDRMMEVNREIAEFGCKLVGQLRHPRHLRFRDNHRSAG